MDWCMLNLAQRPPAVAILNLVFVTPQCRVQARSNTRTTDSLPLAGYFKPFYSYIPLLLVLYHRDPTNRP